MSLCRGSSLARQSRRREALPGLRSWLLLHCSHLEEVLAKGRRLPLCCNALDVNVNVEDDQVEQE